MEPEHIIDETATIQGADIEKVYDDCILWLELRKSYLRRESVSLENQIRPNTIVAYHRISGDVPTENKIIRINLSEGQDGVSVRLIMDTTFGTARRDLFDPSLTATYWSYLVESLWGKLGIEMDIEMRRRMYPRHHLDTVIAEKRGWTILRSFVSFMMMAMGLYGPTKLYIFSLFGLGYFLFTMYQYYQFVRIRDNLYPDR